MSEANDSSDDPWIPLADLMTGLAVLFLLAMIAVMARARPLAPPVPDQVVVSDAAQRDLPLETQLYQALASELGADLPAWHASLSRDLGVSFLLAEGQFATGDAALSPAFQGVLAQFAPRYLGILTQPRFVAVIDEIRLEGHTSTAWRQKPPLEAYLANMELSQRRAFAALRYILARPALAPQQAWMMARLTAIGRSSARPQLAPDGREDAPSSQRVEFRIRLAPRPSVALQRAQAP